MTQTQLVEKIRAMPAAKQLEVAESILHGLGLTVGALDRERKRRQMQEAASAAKEYYRTDPDVALWRDMDAEPFHE